MDILCHPAQNGATALAKSQWFLNLLPKQAGAV
jgi:hypothetical protein